MIAKVLCEKFPFASHYFEALLGERVERFPQSIVFEGMDIFGEIFFSLELARVLNCTQEGESDCSCLNCKWIREGNHPAVTFVSQLDFKPQDDETKTVISAKQAQEIIKTLGQTSDFHRVFIFLDAKAESLNESEQLTLESYAGVNFKLPQTDWKPSSLTYKTFSNDTANALLKSVEEPPLRTTFIFLTKNREDLMQTIVSRSQTFKLPAKRIPKGPNELSSYFREYPDITLEKALEISQELQEYSKENDVSAAFVLDMAESHLGELLKANIENEMLTGSLKRDIKFLGRAKKQLRASMSPKVVFDSLFIEMSQR